VKPRPGAVRAAILRGAAAGSFRGWVYLWQLPDPLPRERPAGAAECRSRPSGLNRVANRLNQLGSFCRRMGREARQGEVGLVIGDEYLAFRDFSKE
jgi:hypothetical protein